MLLTIVEFWVLPMLNTVWRTLVIVAYLLSCAQPVACQAPLSMGFPGQE